MYTVQSGLAAEMVSCLGLALVVLVLTGVEAVPVPGPEPDPAKLRRVPRIYNALITTDEELLPSQAYPAVAPVLRPYSPYSPYGLPPPPPAFHGSYGVYAPDPYSLQSYNRIPGFNETLQDPEARTLRGQPPQASLYSLQPRQTIPQISDQVKNNRPPNHDIPDVPPPPLPLSPPRGRNDQSPERKPDNYPPAPPQGLPFL